MNNNTLLFDQIQETVAFIRTHTDVKPKTGIVLGTGLGNLTKELQVSKRFRYQDLPHFPVSTVDSHQGELIFGTLQNQPVVVMAGRFHYYEGYSMQQVTFPIRVLKYLGIQQLFLSNAAGGLNPEFEAGDLVLVKDHINLQPANPLTGTNDLRIGPRFPDMLFTYDKALRNKAKEFAQANAYRLHEGVYVCLPGPNLETPAEYRFMHIIGGDLVGMSTVPEVLVARHMNLNVLVISVVTNKCYPMEELTETTLEEVIATAAMAEPKMTALIKHLLRL